MSGWLPALVVLLGGALVALQAPTNAQLGRAVGSPVNAALISFTVGAVALAALALLLRGQPDVAALRRAPAHLWLGGLYGAVLVASTAWAAGRLSLAFIISLLVLGQLAAGLALDHFGALGLDRQPVTPVRLLGAALVLTGALLLRR